MNDPTATQFEQMGRAKVTEFRHILRWRRVEPTRPPCVGKPSCHSYKWAGYDKLFGSAASRNIRILPYIHAVPVWANATDERFPPSTAFARQALSDFAAAVTKRYGPHGKFWVDKPYPTGARVHYLQIWNEPNLKQYWNNRPNPGQYANMLRATSDAANAVDPAIRIVAAGLPWGTGIMPEPFLREMFAWNRRALQNKVDVIASHAYRTHAFEYSTAVRSIRNTLKGISSTVGARPIWVTEMGWATGSYDGRYRVSESKQASNLTDAYDRLLAQRRTYGIGRAFWYTRADLRGHSEWWFHSGLFRSDGSKKPSWFAFNRVTGGSP